MSNRRAAVYVRISDDKDEDGAGVARQEKDCRALAERQGWAVAEIYTENDTSAYKRRTVRLPDGSTGLRVVRPAFRRLLDDLTAGVVDALIGYDLDRVARDPRDLEDLIDVVEQHRIPTKAVTGSLDLGNDNGVTMARVMVAVANKSSRDTGRRVSRKQEELAEQGRYKGGGIRAYGYARDGMTVVEEEAAVIRDAAERLLSGQSLRAVAKYLNDTGVPTVRGGARGWDGRSVQVVVTKPRVAGLRTHRGEVVGPAAWPAVLDTDTWERLLMVLEDRKLKSGNTLRYWLTGVLRCSKCGAGLRGARMGGANGGRERYWCNTTRGEGCGGIAIDCGQTESTVEGLLLAYLARPDVLADLRAVTSSSSVDHARGEVHRDQEQLRELAALWAARSITTPEYMTARKEIEQRVERAQALLRSALPGAVRELVAGDVEGTWQSFTPAKRREVAEVVFPEGVVVQPRREGAPRAFDPDRLVPAGRTS